MIKYMAILGIVIISVFFYANSQTWEMIIGTDTTYDQIHDAAITLDGNFALWGEGMGYGFYLILLDQYGDSILTKQYDIDTTVGGSELGVSMLCLQNEDLILGGFMNVGAGSECRIIRTNSNGELLWSRLFRGDLSGPGIACTPDGGFIAAGTGWSGSYVIRVRGNGDPLFARLDYPGTFCNIDSVGDDTYIICGGIGIGGAVAGLLIKINGEGDIIWTREYPYATWPDFPCLVLLDVVHLPDGGFVAAGWTNIDTIYAENELYVMRTDSIGDTIWTRVYGNTKSAANDIDILPDSGFIVTGYLGVIDPIWYDIWLLRLNKLW